MIIWLRNLLLSACSVSVILVAVIIPGTTAYAQEITAKGADEAQFDGVIDNKYLAKPNANKDSVTLTNPDFDGEIDNADISAIQLYSQDELIRLINQNRHLQRVQNDR